MKVPNSGFDISNPAKPLLDGLVAFWGITDADGVPPVGTTLICLPLGNEPSYANMTLKLLSGPCAGQEKTILTIAAGLVTVDSAFTNPAGVAQQIVAGSLFAILSNSAAAGQILAIVKSIAGGTYWLSFGPGNVEIAQAVTFGVTVFDPGGGIIPQANITAGTYTIDRIRVGAVIHVIGSSASSKMDGAVYAGYNFPLADGWAIGDLGIITFSSIQIIIGGITTSLPPIQVWTRLVMEPDIDTIVNTINTVQGTKADAATLDDLSDVTTTTTEAKLRRILLRIAPAAISSRAQGVAYTDLMTFLNALATYISTTGNAFNETINPGSAARANIELALKDLSDILAGAGITTYPVGAVAGNGISMAQVIRYIQETCIGYEGATSIAAKLTAVRAVYLDTLNTGVLVGSRTTAAGRLAGITQIFSKHITSAANAGDVTVATITTQPCLIKSIVLRSNGATTANLTSAAIYGGAGKVITFISSADGVLANIAAADQQVAWQSNGGAVSFAATKTIIITLTGTGAGAVDLQVDIEFEAIADGGYLA